MVCRRCRMSAVTSAPTVALVVRGQVIERTLRDVYSVRRGRGVSPIPKRESSDLFVHRPIRQVLAQLL